MASSGGERSQDQKRFVFRAPGPLYEAMVVEAEKAGLTPSEFVRRSIEASIHWGWVARMAKEPGSRVEVPPKRTDGRSLGLRVVLPSGGCMHPPTAHEQEGPFRIVCGLCGALLKRTQ